MITAATILDAASSTLLDTARRTWPLADLLAYLNEALNSTAGVKADFYTIEDYVQLAEGDLQEIPSDGISLMKISENRNGRIITQADFDLLQESNRFWPGGTTEVTIENYASDPRNPRRFIVSPPSNGQSFVRMLYASAPQVTSDTDAIDVPGVYTGCLTDYVLSKAYEKNSQRQDLAKSQGYRTRWGTFLGLKSQTQIAVAPSVISQPGTASPGGKP